MRLSRKFIVTLNAFHLSDNKRQQTAFSSYKINARFTLQK